MTEVFSWSRIDPDRKARLQYYAEELLRWSKTYNLIGPCVRDELFDRHFRDGALLLDHVPAIGKLADVGSGAGLPGIVVAILAGTFEEICLIESRKKRVRFLRHIVSTLGLAQVRVFHGEAQAAGAAWAGRFDTVVSRGIGDLLYGAREAWVLLRPGGRYVTFKGFNYQEELKLLKSNSVADLYDMPVILYEEDSTGNRIIALTKK
ncbi:MAG: 16S rRNA (guanine(527)-N(7))-methyltransferase RsmG [Magnetococcales bacterium]|nr:16S rRNA (guanine(527)-N(7))-methyltransferase RsmG [Magnetococcales bacterium]MBF0435946.1 16S rRNA (guanine(527)-N(7))-methyltransferase RsmG [Magnetococcales bacterium]